MPLLLARLLALGTPLPLSHNSEASLLRKAHCAPSVFVEEISDDQEDYVPGDDGPGDDSPDGNDPDGDDPSDDDPEPHNDDDDDEEGEPIDGLPSQDDTGMIIFNNLSIAIDRLMHSVQSSNSSSSCTKVHEPDTFDGTNPKKLRTFFIQCELNF